MEWYWHGLPNLYVCIFVIITSLWRWPHCWRKHVGENTANKIHHKYFSTFVGYVHIFADNKSFWIPTMGIKNSRLIICFVDRASRNMRVIKPTWCIIYLQFIEALMAGRHSTKTYNTYQLSHIYFAASWWWATNKPETCRGIVIQ
jgi:hypothetical protein